MALFCIWPGIRSFSVSSHRSQRRARGIRMAVDTASMCLARCALVWPFGKSVGLGPAEIVLLEHGVSPARFVFVFVGRARARSFCWLQLQRGFLEHLRLLIVWSKKVLTPLPLNKCDVFPWLVFKLITTRVVRAEETVYLLGICLNDIEFKFKIKQPIKLLNYS